MSENKRILVALSVTTLASFLSGFNARLAVVGIPTIAGDLGADVWSMVWIIQGFMLGSTFLQLVVGRLADIYGRVRIFLIGIGVFTLGALLAGLSINPLMLIFSRIIQGTGGAILMSLSVTILTDNVPSSRLATWLGVNQIAWRAGALLGLTLSGVIIDLLGWRWIFLTQVPVGLIVLLWSKSRLREVYVPRESRRIDVAGFVLFTASVTLLLIGLTMLGYGYRVFSTDLVIISLILLILFIAAELRTRDPALDLRLFKIWQFTGGILSQLLYSIGFGASLTLLAIYMQSVLRLSPSATGILLIPFEASFMIFGLIGGWLSDRIGYAPVTVAGLTISSIALYMLSRVSRITSVAVSELVLGLGTGLFVSPNTSSIMTSVPPRRRGVASSIRSVSFNIGFVLSLNTAILSMTQILPYEVVSQLIVLEHIPVGDKAIVLELEELGDAIKHSFLVQAIVMALAIPFSLSRVKRVSRDMREKMVSRAQST